VLNFNNYRIQQKRKTGSA